MLTITGCSSRKAQCLKLLQSVNQGNTLISIKGKTYNAATTKQLATELNTIADNIDSLRLSSGRLKQAQAGFAQVFHDLSKVLAEMGQAFEAGEKTQITPEGRTELLKAIDQANQSGQSVTELTQRANQLVDEMAKACPSKLTQD
ncbi:MAG: hypothetical protein HC920_15175 [Oscillatoriales cyanobacterium SM2_3_0]|nr:hypothetical protein [Oscillatoriales cyanobacterium SM2_3_0]